MKTTQQNIVAQKKCLNPRRHQIHPTTLPKNIATASNTWWARERNEESFKKISFYIKKIWNSPSRKHIFIYTSVLDLEGLRGKKRNPKDTRESCIAHALEVYYRSRKAPQKTIIFNGKPVITKALFTSFSRFLFIFARYTPELSRVWRIFMRKSSRIPLYTPSGISSKGKNPNAKCLANRRK